MKQTIIAAAAVVWFAVAVPGQAVAFTGGASNVRIEVTIGASRFDGFAGRGHHHNRPRFDRRFPGFGFFGRGFFGRDFYGGGHNRGAYYGRGHNGGGYRLPAHVIISSLRARHFYRISMPRFSRGLYHARARDSHGRRVRLAIDPYSGHIIRLRFRF
ncbi:MAG: hypothetical protein IIB67_03320 [Proteobacteria bacterium]|nr:hypothetical protein [Pseudomonadota bacterium]